MKRQAELLDELSRGTVYYKPAPTSEADLALMAAMYEIHLALPFYGIRRIRDELRDRGFRTGRGHVATLLRKIGSRRSIPTKLRLSKPHPARPHGLPLPPAQAGHHSCWAGVAGKRHLPTRGEGILLPHGSHGLWASRRVLSWRLSNTLDASFCIEALEEPLARYGALEIFKDLQHGQ